MVDFGRLNHISRVIRTDYDAWSDEEKPSAAFLPLRWCSKAKQVLDLPVPPRDEPVAVSGEIDTDKKGKRNMYGNNGNGYGNGYGQMGDFYDRFDNTKPITGGARDPFIATGDHELAVISITEKMPDQRAKDARKGPKVVLLFEVIRSQVHRPGSRVVKFYYTTQPSNFPGGDTDADRFADFVKKLKNIKDPNHRIGQDIRVLLRDRASEQLARGMRIRCVGGEPRGKSGFVEVYWHAIDQTPEEIAQHRQRIESTPGLIPPDQGGQAYGPPMSQQQPAQPPAQPPAQMTPQQAASAWGQWQQQPAQMPPAPPQAQPPAQPPGGGFLSQIPGFGGQPPQGGGGNPGGAPPAAW